MSGLFPRRGVEVARVSRAEYVPFLGAWHYADVIPQVIYAFGFWLDGILEGVCTLGLPASPSVCRGFGGGKFADRVLELNRFALRSNRKNDASFFISRVLREMQKPQIIISYSDTARGHHGGIYQAANFLYVGVSPSRRDYGTRDGKHPRHRGVERGGFVLRSDKHRYIFFVGNRAECREMRAAMPYKIIDYPKPDRV